MHTRRIAAILLGVAAVMALTAYAYIWEPARISGGSPDVTEPVETAPYSPVTEEVTPGVPDAPDTPDTEITPITEHTEIPGYIAGEYVSEGGIRITLDSNRRGTWKEGGRESEVFWMYDSAEDGIKVFDYEGNSFVGKYEGGRLTGLLNYSDEIVFYETAVAPPDIAELPEPPYNPSVFQMIDTFFHGGFGFTVYGAEFFRDADGVEAVRVWFDFSNYSKVAVKPSDLIELRMYSGDKMLDRCKNSELDEASEFDRTVEDGESVRVAAEFRVDWKSADMLTFQIRHEEYNAAEAAGTPEILTDGLYIIIAQFDPATLPALPLGGVLPPLVQY